MKRYVKASHNIYSFEPGEQVTVYNGTYGYSNYEATFLETEINRHGVEMAVVESRARGQHQVPLSSIIPSQYQYFKSLTFDDVVSKSFVKKMIYDDDSMWCDRIRVSRVDRDASIENLVGCEAHIMGPGNFQNRGYRVCIIEYISKHYDTTKDYTDKYNLSVNDPLIDEALDILKSADKVVVNFAGYQRIIEK